MEYNMEEHRHRFSAWAAARAAQRGFTSVKTPRKALEGCGIRKFLKVANLNAVDDKQFRRLHKKWCGAIIKTLKKRRVPNTTYGRAAKLIAVYIKSMIVIGPHSRTSLARVAHPPIDRTLLKNIAEAMDVASPCTDGVTKKNWTKLEPDEYYELVEQLRRCLPHGQPFWKLEQYWP